MLADVDEMPALVVEFLNSTRIMWIIIAYFFCFFRKLLDCCFS